VEIEGVGLFFGRSVRLRCLPAEPDTGAVFVRTDLPGRPRISASVQNVPGPRRWTALRSGEAEVHVVEHLLSALAGLGIDNLVIEANAAEMPAGDGSAKTYTDAFLHAGIKELDAPARRFKLSQPLAITDKEIALAAAPQDEGLTLTYVLDYGPHFLRTQALTLSIDSDSYTREIAPARTYVLRPEVDAFMKQGLGKGATPENTIVLEQNGEASGTLRFPDEYVRHKMLDLIGDLYLAGAPLSARVIGYKSGHAANIRLARAIREACDELNSPSHPEPFHAED